VSGHRHALVLGKFMPPHAGHLYLCRFALGLADRVTVVVGSMPHEPIPGALRLGWMRRLVPDAAVVHLDAVLPQHPREHPNFWPIWRRALEGILPAPVDLVVAGEDYGETLAQTLGAFFAPLTRGHAFGDLCATAVRADPLGRWAALPDCVRAFYARRVRVVGPESAGKTTLAAALAERFGTLCVPEYARTLLEPRGGALERSDLPLIARGQAASEDALAERCDRVLICDTDPTLTAVWSEALFGAVDPAVHAAAAGRSYALTLLLAPLDGWAPDPVRYQPEAAQRRAFFERCLEVYPADNRMVLSDPDPAARTARAVDAVAALLSPPG
jgi:HTH-type transcriptional repressor of NAD biosynthesis genes